MSIAYAVGWTTVINHINEHAVISGKSGDDPPGTR
jgi:hypothetical protein